MQIFPDSVFPVPRADFPPDVHQDDLREAAHGVTQHRQRSQPVEELDAPEIAFAEIAFGIQPTAPRHLIEDGLLEEGAEGVPPRPLVQRRQKRTVHLLLNAVHCVFNVFVRHLFGDLLQRQHNRAYISQIIGAGQVGQEPILVAIFEPPDIRIGRAAHGVGVRDVKHIAQSLRLGGNLNLAYCLTAK